MYKIYINDRPLVLCASSELSEVPDNERILRAKYLGKSKFLLNYVDMLEKATPKLDGVVLHAEDGQALWESFCKQYLIVEAAGGLVSNARQEWLLIFRLEHWDLPKGKIDPGETPAVAAVREVQEETGLDQVQLGDFLLTTYHTYRDRHHQRVLKPTYWYAMQTEQEKLQPQESENIEKAVWMSKEIFFAEDRVTYPNILHVLQKG